MYTEKIEGLILAEIQTSSKHSMNLTKKYLGPVNKLFESVFDNSPKYQPINTLENCRHNKLHYFNSVKNTLNEYVNNLNHTDIVALNESIQVYNKASDDFKLSVDNFIFDLDKEIDSLKNENDFNKFDSYSPLVQKTLLFQKKPINICGFNVFEFLNPSNIISKELLEKFGANLQTDLKLLLFNKSDKEIYFVFEKNKTEKTIIFYNIYSNDLDFLQNKNLFEQFGISNDEFFGIIWQDEKKIVEHFKRHLNATTIELYRNFSKFNIVFQDNLYKDIAWDNYNQQRKNQSIIK